MNVNIENIEVDINGKIHLVNLRWMRGANRYNNGGNNNGKILKTKYLLGLIFRRLKQNNKEIK